jgi:hypothetical protein
MRGVAAALAAVFWLLFIFLAIASLNAGDELLPFEEDSFRAIQVVAGVGGLLFTLMAAKPASKNLFEWVSPRPGSLPFVGWIAVAGPVLIAALFAPDSNARLAFAIAFGVIAVLIGIASALPWAIAQRVMPEEMLKKAEMPGSHSAEPPSQSSKTSLRHSHERRPTAEPDQPTT